MKLVCSSPCTLNVTDSSVSLAHNIQSRTSVVSGCGNLTSTATLNIYVSSAADPSSRKGFFNPLHRRSLTTGLERPRRRSFALNTIRSDSTSKAEQTEKESAYKVPDQSTLGSSPQSHFDLLERLTSDSNSTTTGAGKTIAQQLEEDLQLNEAEEITIPLGSGILEMEPLTISQKRNIRRQNYLNEVAKRNDAPFFTILFLCVIVPPAAILGVAVATGYVDLFP